MSFKKELAEKMLKEKLDFLGLEDSLELEKKGEMPSTNFSWVYNNEEVSGDDWDLEFTGDNLEEIKKEMMEVYGKEDFVVGKGYGEFNEFTTEICKAPTYIDLIK